MTGRGGSAARRGLYRPRLTRDRLECTLECHHAPSRTSVSSPPPTRRLPHPAASLGSVHSRVRAGYSSCCCLPGGSHSAGRFAHTSRYSHRPTLLPRSLGSAAKAVKRNLLNPAVQRLAFAQWSAQGWAQRREPLRVAASCILAMAGTLRSSQPVPTWDLMRILVSDGKEKSGQSGKVKPACLQSKT